MIRTCKYITLAFHKIYRWVRLLLWNDCRNVCLLVYITKVTLPSVRRCWRWNSLPVRQPPSQHRWVWITQVRWHTHHETSDSVYRAAEYRPITSSRPFTAVCTSTGTCLSDSQGSLLPFVVLFGKDFLVVYLVNHYFYHCCYCILYYPGWP